MMLNDYPDRDLLFISLANALAEALETALLSQDRVTLAVPGGTTPGPMFDELSAADIDWSRVDVMLSDERLVPADHARSNERLVRERLLVGRAAAATFLRYVPDADHAIEDLCADLSGRLPVDVLLLGMGADMHTASLFPGARALPAALAGDAPPLMLVDAPGAPEPRITLTGRVLSGAMASHILITGEDKRAALENARSLPAEKAPVSIVLGQAEIHWAP